MRSLFSRGRKSAADAKIQGHFPCYLSKLPCYPEVSPCYCRWADFATNADGIVVFGRAAHFSSPFCPSPPVFCPVIQKKAIADEFARHWLLSHPVRSRRRHFRAWENARHFRAFRRRHRVSAPRSGAERVPNWRAQRASLCSRFSNFRLSIAFRVAFDGFKISDRGSTLASKQMLRIVC
jgi:hypothetical protein